MDSRLIITTISVSKIRKRGITNVHTINQYIRAIVRACIQYDHLIARFRIGIYYRIT